MARAARLGSPSENIQASSDLDGVEHLREVPDVLVGSVDVELFQDDAVLPPVAKVDRMGSGEIDEPRVTAFQTGPEIRDGALLRVAPLAELVWRVLLQCGALQGLVFVDQIGKAQLGSALSSEHRRDLLFVVDRVGLQEQVDALQYFVGRGPRQFARRLVWQVERPRALLRGFEAAPGLR